MKKGVNSLWSKQVWQIHWAAFEMLPCLVTGTSPVMEVEFGFFFFFFQNKTEVDCMCTLTNKQAPFVSRNLKVFSLMGEYVQIMCLCVCMCVCVWLCMSSVALIYAEL